MPEQAPADAVVAAEQWLLRHGLPWFVDDIRAQVRNRLRTRALARVGLGAALLGVLIGVVVGIVTAAAATGVAVGISVAVVRLVVYALRSLQASAIAPGTLELVGSNGASASGSVRPGRKSTVSLSIDVPPGLSSVTVRTDVEPLPEDERGVDPRPVRVQLFTASIDVAGDLTLADVADALDLP